MLKIPAGITTNIQLNQLARHMRIPYFIGAFMRDALPISGARQNESGGSRYSLGSVCEEK